MLVLCEQLLNFSFRKFNVEGTQACAELYEKKGYKDYSCTYGSLSNSALSKLVEIEEELLDSNPVFGDEGLESFFYIELAVHEARLFLLGGGVETVHDRDCFTKI